MEIGIIGASGIGYHHARIFTEIGANVRSIYGTSNESVHKASVKLSNDLDIEPQTFTSIDGLLSSDIDAVSICSPYQYHYENIIAAFDRGLSVFCEKPIFWDFDIDHNQALNNIDTIADHPNRKIVVNSSNVSFLNYIPDLDFLKRKVDVFSFIFHTNGRNNGVDIIIDLVPHAVSFVVELLGYHKIYNYREFVASNKVLISFAYAGASIYFEFIEGSKIEKRLEFTINERCFKRVQAGYGKDYKVSIYDESNGGIYEADDPFYMFMKQFVNMHINSDFHGFDMIYDNFLVMNNLMNTRVE